MKTILNYLAVAAVAALFFVSCSPQNELDRNLLIGRWVSGTLTDIYYADGSGKSWDTADDVSEPEAQWFRWTLTGSTLTRNECLEMTGNCDGVPMDYQVSKLTATSLVYSRLGRTYSFTNIAPSGR